MDLFSANQLMWAAFIVGNSAPLLFILLNRAKKISNEFFNLYFLGVLVGLTWEIPFALAGKSFHLILIDWPIDLPLARNITYSFIDGLIFIVGVLLAKFFLKSNDFLHRFNSTALLIMILWGSFSEFLVDLNGNGKLWLFMENWYNPVFIIINGNGLTIIPQLIWFFAPIVYYFSILKFQSKIF
tara:strand:- start:734 stop:1285 length:552 start_codon:yes stop_codon:yes gene_type:complete